MPTCCSCGEGYAAQTHWEPKEYCQCGACWDGSDSEPGEVETKRAEWVAQVEEERKDAEEKS